MAYNIGNLPQALQTAIKEFSVFSLSDDGCNIVACAGDDRIDYNGSELTVCYSDTAHFIHSLFLFEALGRTGTIRCAFQTFSVLVDMSRNAVRRVETVKAFMRQIVLLGYTQLQIYMEDVFEIDDEPYFGHMRGRYGKQELKEIVSYGKKIGLECVPAVQTLAHMNGITRWRKYATTVIDTDDIFLVDEPKTYELLEKIFATMQECFGGTFINIGCDEAHRLGLGKYLDLHGYTDRAALLVKHLQRVVAIAQKYGFTNPMMWNDMFPRLASKGQYAADADIKISDEILRLIPKNVSLACWSYFKTDKKFYEDMFRMQQKFQRPLYYAAGAVSWLGVTPLNWLSLKQNKAAISACKKMNVENYILTTWGDDGGECSLFATLPTVVYTAALACGETDYKTLFQRLTGVSFDKFMRIDSPNEIAETDAHFLAAQPSRYMLYNDPLQGLYDSTVRSGDGEKFKSIALKLHALTQNKDWGYLFKTQESIAKLLYYKYELTVKTRNAYRKNDREALQKIVDCDYKRVLKYIDEYYNSFRAQWYQENKPYGFEVQDYRIGGLKQRVLNCRRILQDYLNGRLARVEELENEPLSVTCGYSEDGRAVDVCTVKEVITANVFSHR